MKVNRETKQPLYMQVYQYLKQALQSQKYKSGDFLPSERELSQSFTVDRLTVRRALEMLAGEGLVEKKAGLGTRVAEKPPVTLGDTVNPKNLIFFLPQSQNAVERISGTFYSGLFFTIENEIKKRGYRLSYTTLSEKEEIPPILKSGEIAGVFFVSKISAKFLRDAHRLTIPAVVVNSENDYFSSILTDRVKGTYEAVQHLINLDHRCFCFISGIPDYITSQASFEGFKRALGDGGLDLHNQVIKEGNWQYDGGYKAMQEVLAEHNPLPTAVVACNDETAFGAMEAIKSLGRSIPEDFSVVGFDDIDQAGYYRPKLTTVRVDIELIAKAACQQLFYIIENKENTPFHIVIPTKVIVRESTARAK